MKVLILRTFAHPRIWENENDKCEYEYSQLDEMIFSWEPDYVSHDIDNIKFALGIYTSKYFNHKSKYGNKIYCNTDEEHSISVLKLRRYSREPKFAYYSEEKKLYVHYSFQKKLWANRNKELMSKIDDKFVKAKKSELKKKIDKIPKTTYTPLSFVLEENVVNSILAEDGITI